ncbi:hypothetical protein ACFJIS_18860 [Variovorax boronicumulans]|uniref:hypothetical protein n=1 Tax=Variovorax boronicumulans TaxID=436515 RepID=UPI0036F1E548
MKARITAWLRTLAASIAARLIGISDRRPPDFVIGSAQDPYLLRWWLLPRNPVLNVYLHCFLRSDDDRALHDHPWANLSVLLRGKYLEHTIDAGGIHHRRQLAAGNVRLRALGTMAHRVELHEGACWTLFITGPRYREWGFHCPDEGWIHWERFTAEDDPGAIGRGCAAGPGKGDA